MVGDDLEAGVRQMRLDFDRLAIDDVREMVMHPFVRHFEGAVRLFRSHRRHTDDAQSTAGDKDATDLREDVGDRLQRKQLQRETYRHGIKLGLINGQGRDLGNLQAHTRVESGPLDPPGRDFRHPLGDVNAANVAGVSNGIGQSDQRVPGAVADFENLLALVDGQ